MERLKINARYKTFIKVKHSKLNGRHCIVEGCGVALKGDYRYRCPMHAAAVDDYGMSIGICL